jgi:hypothetical protein
VSGRAIIVTAEPVKDIVCPSQTIWKARGMRVRAGIMVTLAFKQSD